jgi:hypothetical protein
MAATGRSTSSPGDGLAVGVALQAAPVAAARPAPEHLDGWVVGPVDQGEHGDDHGQQHPVQHPQDQHPDQRDHAEDEVAEAEQADAVEGGRVDQAGHGHHDHRPQGGLGQVLEQGGQEQQGEDHDQGGGDAGELAAGARPAVDGRLGQAPTGREALEKAAGQVGGAEGPQFLVGVDLGVVGGGEGPGGRDRLDEGHQGDPGRRPDQLADQGEVGRGQLGQAGWDGADQGHPPVGQAGGDGEDLAQVGQGRADLAPAPGPGRRRPPRPRRPRSGRPGSRWC